MATPHGIVQPARERAGHLEPRAGGKGDRIAPAHDRAKKRSALGGQRVGGIGCGDSDAGVDHQCRHFGVLRRSWRLRSASKISRAERPRGAARTASSAAASREPSQVSRWGACGCGSSFSPSQCRYSSTVISRTGLPSRALLALTLRYGASGMSMVAFTPARWLYYHIPVNPALVRLRSERSPSNGRKHMFFRVITQAT